MKHTLILLLFSCAAWGQEIKTLKDDSSRIATTTFFIKLKTNKINYPKAAVANGIEGQVILVMDIDSTCSVINRRVKQGLGFGCDEEALKILNNFQSELKKQHKLKCGNIKDLTLPLNFKMH